MEKQNRLLVIASVVLLALVAFIVIDNQQNGGQKRETDPEAVPTEELVAYKSDEVAVLTVKNGGGAEVRFEKTDGAWAMVSPKSVPIDERRVTEIIDRFDPALFEVRELKGDLVGFGLDPESRAQVTFATADGRSWTVWVGKQTTVGYGTYVQTVADGPVNVAKTHLADLAHRGVDDFRSKALWKVSSGTARRIELRDVSRSVVLRKDDHGWWLGDQGPRVDTSAVEAWLQQADLLRAESFVDEGPVEISNGTRITVEDADGPHVLTVGDVDDGGVLVKGEGPLARVGASVLDLLKFGGWEGVELLPVRSFQVDNIAITLGDWRATFVKLDGVWKDADGKDTALPPGLLDQLKLAKAVRTVVPAEAASGWGSITLAETAGDTVHRESLTLGDVVPGDIAGRAARDASGGPSFVVPQSELDVILGVARGTLPPPTPAKPEGGGFEGFPGMGM